MSEFVVDDHVENILSAVRRLLNEPCAWIKAHFAHDSNGLMDDPCSSSAVSWCLSGALTKVVVDGGYTHSQKDDVRRYIMAITEESSIAWWNDNVAKSHRDVIELLDKAIRKAKRP